MRGVSKRNRGLRLLAGACLAGGAIVALPMVSRASLLSNVVFNDTLATNGSTLNSASQSYSNTATPTSTSTNYDVASSKESIGTPNSNLTSGNPLELNIASTSGGIAEVQALFTSTPIVLNTIGQAIEITTTFKDTAGLNLNSSSAIYVGLYGSGGVAPYNNLGNGSSSSNTITGISNSEIQENTGGVAGWVGYESDFIGTQSDKIYSRPAQSTSTTNNVDQALVGDGQTGGVENAAGTQATYTSQNTDADLSVGSTYTDEMSITLSAAGVYTITDALYSGASDTGTLISGGTPTVTSGTDAVLGSGSFDGMAIGYRESDSVAGEMDISSVEVTTNVPEPASIGLLGLTGAGLMWRRRRRA
jgi:hypothetical protein